jgi:hypothetical protein
VFCAGIVAAAVYNVNREKGSPAITAKDFLPEQRPNASDEDLVDAMVGVFSELGNFKQQN